MAPGAQVPVQPKPSEPKPSEIKQPQKSAKEIKPEPAISKEVPTNPKIEKTVVLPADISMDDDKTIVEQTVIQPPKLKPEDIPTLNNIERNFHPSNMPKAPDPSDSADEKNQKKEWEL